MTLAMASKPLESADVVKRGTLISTKSYMKNKFSKDTRLVMQYRAYHVMLQMTVELICRVYYD